MRYEFYKLNESNSDFIKKIIRQKKEDKDFILDDIQRFNFSLAIHNGCSEQRITHSQETYNYSKSYWLPADYPFEGEVIIDLSK